MEYAYSRRRGNYFENSKQILIMALMIDLIDTVENLYSNIPDKRKRKEYQDWKQTINIIIQDINKLCKFKMYNQIK